MYRPMQKKEVTRIDVQHIFCHERQNKYCIRFNINIARYSLELFNVTRLKIFQVEAHRHRVKRRTVVEMLNAIQSMRSRCQCAMCV